MKKVLIIAHQFPPMGGSGVQRTTKFVKYLGKFDWEPVVFTRDIKRMALKDESLCKDVPKNVSVIRSNPWDFSEFSGIVRIGGKVLNKILVPDGERLWQFFGRKKAVQAINEHSIDLIYTTSYPYSDHLMGLYLKSKFPSIPWVADFRDEWTNNPYILDNPHNPVRTKMERSMEISVLKHADCLITNTPVMLKNFVEKNPSVKDKFFVIPNGYDEEDFKNVNLSPIHNKKLTLTYTGAFYRRRKPDILFEALHKLITENKLDKNDILVKLIGNFKSGYMEDLINKYDLNGVVNILPYMKHEECIQQLVQSDALLLIEGGGRGAEAFYTGKVFEYMSTGRPILAMIPENGAAAGLIRDTGTGYVSDSEDVVKTAENILACYNNWKNSNMAFSPNWDEIRKFERKELTRELSNVFKKALDKIK